VILSSIAITIPKPASIFRVLSFFSKAISYSLSSKINSQTFICQFSNSSKFQLLASVIMNFISLPNFGHNNFAFGLQIFFANSSVFSNIITSFTLSSSAIISL
jgi:hypothetical protein